MRIANQQKERKRNRLRGYNYAQDGWYFITICTKDREEFFGKIENDQMILNHIGNITKECWFDLPKHYKNCVLDEFVIMPNHIHGIVVIEKPLVKNVGTGLKPVPTEKMNGLSEIIRGFKTFSSRKINEKNQHITFQWQRSFYDHIIRDEKSLYNIRTYIQNNPLQWTLDQDNPENLYY